MTQHTSCTRRGFLRTAVTATSGLALTTWAGPGAVRADTASNVHLPSPHEALEILIKGNQRFVAMKMQGPHRNAARRKEISPAQAPFATIMACIDSRVPPEIVFDQGLGDMFVIRSAGEALDNVILGSIEFASGLSTMPLLMVLGHSSCGAVKTTIRVVDQKEPVPPGTHLEALVNEVRPALDVVRHREGDLVENTVRMQVEFVVNRLRNLPLLGKPQQQSKLLIVGGVYNLQTGAVDFSMV